MNFSDRTYPAIARDLLTLLTGGVVAEQHEVGATLDRIHLENPPVRRVSNVEGEILVGEERVPYRFTERDFELVDDGGAGVALRFRDGGKRPAPDSVLFVNYYPTRLKPTPITDVNVGSVARTLLETIAFELAVQYQQLQKVYDSGFVDTAQGPSLDKVVALVDVRRVRRGHPVGKVRFSRKASSQGDITLPINTVVSDGKGSRYLTSEEVLIPAGQPSMEVWVQGELSRTKIVEPGALNVLERAIAGVDHVSNDAATYPLTEDERDDQLAARAKGAIHGAGKGTLAAIRFAVTGLPFVSSVTLLEQPEGIPGTLLVSVALSEDTPARRAQVKDEIDVYRPAGIAVDTVFAGPIALAFALQVTLKGASLPSAEVQKVLDGIADRLAALAKDIAPGGVLRRTQVVAAVLADSRVADATVTITADGTAINQERWTVAGDKTVRLERSAVTFDKTLFEDAKGAEGQVLAVDLDVVVVTVQDGLTSLSPLEAAATGKLTSLLTGLDGGKTISFDQILTAIRDDETFAAVPAKTVATIRQDSGAFEELRLGDAAYTLPAGATIAPGKVTFTKESS